MCHMGSGYVCECGHMHVRGACVACNITVSCMSVFTRMEVSLKLVRCPLEVRAHLLTHHIELDECFYFECRPVYADP